MLGISRKKEVEAMGSIADSARDIARSMDIIAEADRERLAFWRALFGNRGASAARSTDTYHRGGVGGLSDHCSNVPPLPPQGPSGAAMLPGERPCINVTPAKAPQKKGRLW